ncbi:e1c3fce5-41d5-47c0-ab84-df258d79030c [Sclerotinia trifoliorum]|uniref:E1c3fce5-41d5-47c0-ab84-df258d79030c n=1 Tax=Sclerotinia trifoliorum TaxID=28548 RepID=A0A8H2W3G3_9HELO|nr:e1c3fce5-41d5-47c0-ab84-df258d79030c [Sclerotinia trifoliorum]
MAHLDPAERYLDASKGWAPVHIGKDWVGTRHLGGGVYGIATLFEYRGNNPDVSPRKIVVKQEGGKGWNLKQESRMLQKLMKYGSEHIIKIYRAYHRTMGTVNYSFFFFITGLFKSKVQFAIERFLEVYFANTVIHTQGTNPDMDDYIVNYTSRPHRTEYDYERYIETQLRQPHLHDIGRIYIECASQGDLHNWMIQNCDETQPSEEYVFRLWECLLRGLMVLKHGTEGWDDGLLQQGSTFHNPIVHLDLKGPNSKIGDNPKPGHGRIRAHKLADFGLALEVPDSDELKRNPAKKREWIKVTQGRNTYHAPEQFYADHPNREIGTQTDLWNIAHVIYQAILSMGFVPPNVVFKIGVDPNPSRTFLTMGPRLLDRDRQIYSRKLRGMLLRALAFDPQERWGLEELLTMVQEVLEHWNFGDETDLFLEGIQGGFDGWKGKYPEPAVRVRIEDGFSGMRKDRLQTWGFPKVPPLRNPSGWTFKEDDDDFDDVELLFPTRKAVRMGYREMPFELGEAKMQLFFPDGRAVGKDGKPVEDEDEVPDSTEEPERMDEETKTTEVKSSLTSRTSIPSRGQRTVKPLRGIKRMRSASQQRKQPSPRFSPNSSQVAQFGRPSEQFQFLAGTEAQTGESQAPHTLSDSQAPLKKRRRYSLTSPPFRNMEGRRYFLGADGDLHSLSPRSTMHDDDVDVDVDVDVDGDIDLGDEPDEPDDGGERSAPWVGYDDYYDYDEAMDE